MILLVFGTIYAVCLFILAWTLFKAKPLLPLRSGQRGVADDRRDAPPFGGGAERSSDVIATHH